MNSKMNLANGGCYVLPKKSNHSLTIRYYRYIWHNIVIVSTKASVNIKVWRRHLLYSLHLIFNYRLHFGFLCVFFCKTCPIVIFWKTRDTLIRNWCHMFCIGVITEFIKSWYVYKVCSYNDNVNENLNTYIQSQKLQDLTET